MIPSPVVSALLWEAKQHQSSSRSPPHATPARRKGLLQMLLQSLARRGWVSSAHHTAKSHDGPSRARRGSACVQMLTPTPDQDARSTELCLAFQLRAKGRRDRASTFDSSQNYSKHRCLGTVQEVAQKRKKNLILIPPSPPPPAITKPEADLGDGGGEGEQRLSRMWQCLSNKNVCRAEKLKVKFPLEKGEERSDTGMYRKAVLAALAPLPRIPCYRRFSPSPSALHQGNTQ